MNETELEAVDLPLNEKFKRAREEQDLTLKDVSEQLNLRMDKLRKLEQADLDFTKLTAFERGYVRNYAQYLSIDITQYESEFPADGQIGSELKSMSRFNYPAPQPFFRKGIIRLLIGIIILLVIGGLMMTL